MREVRSLSMFGFSTIALIFHEDIEFYWARARIIEKINSLPPGMIPDGVQPTLGPDATALGQIFWYTLEPQSVRESRRASAYHDSSSDRPVGGWDLHELRSIRENRRRRAYHPCLEAVEYIGARISRTATGVYAGAG